jgi:hypothetical protein
MKPTAPMFSAANVRTSSSGRATGLERTAGARGMPTTRRTRNAPNQIHARRGRSKAMAPTGARNDQRITPLEGTRPPSARRSRKGVTRISVSSALRRKWKLRVIEKMPRHTARRTTKPHGKSARIRSPKIQ